MRTEEVYNYSESYKYNWLLGRKIVKAEIQSVGIPGERYRSASGYLVLDNGVIVYIIPNEGCGGCSSGNYELSYVDSVDNVITDVQVDDVDSGYDHTTYRLSVFAGTEWSTLMTVDGSDGNGYYGTGFQLKVLIPEGEILSDE